MIYLVFAIIGSAMIGIVMRLSQSKVKAKTSMLAANYITCLISASFFLGDGGIIPKGAGSGFTLWFGTLNGVLYVVSLMLMQRNIRENGVVLPAMFSKIGDLLIPFLGSMLFFSEQPRAVQLIGALLAVVSILAMNNDFRKSNTRSGVLLLALFAIDGMNGFSSKIFDEVGESAFAPQFLFFTFGAALLCCIVVILRDKERPGWWELLFGVLVGIPNYFSSLFLLRALQSIPAVVAYPIRSVGSILLVTLTGVFLFREKLKKSQWIVFPVILLAIVLLSI